MSDTSPLLDLPLIQPSQAQKHVTHNEAILDLDTIVQLVVDGFDALEPPAAPVAGRAHALGAVPTGAWAGQGGALAVWRGGAWAFVTPREGWRAWDLSSGTLRVFAGGAWSATGGGAATSVERLGIGATADDTNRLAVAADATLLTHAGGGHRLKVNKAAPGDTASLLFQTGFSGRAEMGLAGSDDFAIKVSEDGGAFADALRISGADAGVTLGSHLRFPAMPVASDDPTTLDAYAEGAWSPAPDAAGTSAAGVSFTGTGSYVKVGRLVHATFEVTVGGTGTGGAGAVRIIGFPFGAAAGATAAIRHPGIGFGGSGVAHGRMQGASMILASSDGAALNWGSLPGSFVIAGSIGYVASA